MKVVALVTVALAGVASLAAVGYERGFIPGTDGCRLRSVDKREYVERNEAVLRTIRLPRYLREAYSTTWTHAVPARNQCLPAENGPPYSAYITTRVFAGARLGFDERLLDASWARQDAGDVHTTLYRHGDASLAVTTSDEGVLLAVDHRGYADAGH